MVKPREHDEYTDALSKFTRMEQKGRKLTHEQMAERSGLVEVTYRRIASGQTVPEMSQMRRIARAFGMEPSTFLARVESLMEDERATEAANTRKPNARKRQIVPEQKSAPRRKSDDA